MSVPLCVDLDGTLTHSDVFWEAVAVALKRSPLALLRAPLWLLKGPAYLKQQIAAAAPVDVVALPYNAAVLEYLKGEKEAGRQLVLVTAADQSVARAVADHVGLFAEVIASNGVHNVASSHKAETLVQRFGAKQFDYVGNSRRDLPVWQQAKHALVVSRSQRLLAAAAKKTAVERVFPVMSPWRALVSAIRLHQWVKNILLFLPLLMAHQLENPAKAFAAVLACVAFSTIASCLYLVNDVLDVASDRKHATKRLRTIASGQLPISWALVAAVGLAVLSLLISALLPIAFLAALLLYAVAVMSYSFYFKGIVLIDVVVLASFYTLRVLAGAAATDVAVSYWLLAFSLFFFLSLALVKRFAELRALPETHTEKAYGRGYRKSDMIPIAGLGEGSGYLSVLVLALYINSSEVTTLYTHPGMLWLLCPMLLYWISRVWLWAHRGIMNEDPILFAFKDRVSYLVGVLGALLVFLAV